MSKFLMDRKDRAAKAFGTLRSKGATVAKATGTALATGAAFVGTEAMALSAEQNTAISTAYGETETSVGLIITGIFGVALLLAGFGYVLKTMR